MSLSRSQCVLILVWFFLFAAGSHGAEVRVSLAERAPVNRADWLGASARATDRYMGNDPQWLKVVQPMRLAWLRYPGGTVANYWDWRQGNFIPGGNPERPGQVERSPDFTLEDLARLTRVTGATPLFCLNMITDTLDSQLAMLEHAESLGMPVLFVEMGNEINGNHPSNRERFPTATDYGKACAQWIDVLSRRFPDARFGVVGGRRHLWRDTDWTDWNREVLAHATNAHALIIHPYIRAGWALPRARPAPGETAKDVLIKQADELAEEKTIRAFLGLPVLTMQTLEEVANQHPGVPLWLTEFNLADHMSPVGGSWLHGLLVAHYLFLMMDDPRLQMAVFHMLSGERSYSAVYHRAWPRPWRGDTTTPYTLSPAGAVLSLMSSELRDRPVTERLNFDPNPVWPWNRRRARDDFPALVGHRLRREQDDRTYRWVIANMSPQAHTLVWPDQDHAPCLIQTLRGEPASQDYDHLRVDKENTRVAPPYSVTLWATP